LLSPRVTFSRRDEPGSRRGVDRRRRRHRRRAGVRTVSGRLEPAARARGRDWRGVHRSSRLRNRDPDPPFYVRSFGVSDAFIGLLAASYSLAQFLAAPTLGRLSDRIGRRPVLLASLAAAGVAWVVFGYAGAAGPVSDPSRRW